MRKRRNLVGIYGYAFSLSHQDVNWDRTSKASKTCKVASRQWKPSNFVFDFCSFFHIRLQVQGCAVQQVILCQLLRSGCFHVASSLLPASRLAQHVWFGSKSCCDTLLNLCHSSLRGSMVNYCVQFNLVAGGRTQTVGCVRVRVKRVTFP